MRENHCWLQQENIKDDDHDDDDDDERDEHYEDDDGRFCIVQHSECRMQISCDLKQLTKLYGVILSRVAWAHVENMTRMMMMMMLMMMMIIKGLRAKHSTNLDQCTLQI